MKISYVSQTISICGIAGLFSCSPVEENAGPPGGAPFIAPPAEPRRNPSPSPELHRWLAACNSVSDQLQELRTELASLQQLHVANHFDQFLFMDPQILEPAQLHYLNHFLERGYFRIEREILVQLLESRQNRGSIQTTPGIPPPATGSSLTTRLQAVLQRDETLIIDLENVIARYRAIDNEPFQIPVLMQEAELTALREKVSTRIIAERKAVAALDARIQILREG